MRAPAPVAVNGRTSCELVATASIGPPTARSRILGGGVWAFGAALREGTETDPRYGDTLNCDLADHVATANADLGEIERHGEEHATA